MDVKLQQLIRNYKSDPADKENYYALNNALSRAYLPMIPQVEDLRALARELLAQREQVCMRCGQGRYCYCQSAGFGNNMTPQYPALQPYIREMAVRYQTLELGTPLHNEHDGIEMAGAVYARMPHPTFPSDASQLVYGKTSYDAAVNQGGCSDCAQYIQGCMCGTDPDEEPYPLECNMCSQRLRRSNNQAGYTCDCPSCQHCNSAPCQCDWHVQYIGGNYALNVHDDPSQCPCYGSGWLISDMDSVHQCMIHPVTSHHPECDANQPFEECCAPNNP